MYHAWERGATCTGFWWESPKEKDNSKDERVDGRIGSKRTLGILVGGVEWIDLARVRDRWRAVVNAVMNLRVLAPRSYYYIIIVIARERTITISLGTAYNLSDSHLLKNDFAPW
jgi:hypothetical protein